jgi:sirohydrochlorin ferrochelatase
MYVIETLLVDNGSLAPAATLQLRALAKALGKTLGVEVEPVSLLHSSGVSTPAIGDVAAEILEPAIELRLLQGKTDFLIVPLFFGPSGALTDYLPKRIAHLRTKYPDLNVKMAPVLYHPKDDRLSRILADQVRAMLREDTRRVALVDHGSPVRAVTVVRNQLAEQLQELLGPQFKVAPASMERREGSGYDFCDPLLANLLRQPEWNTGDVIVAMQFLLPGRHAGRAGDVAEICNEAEAASGNQLRVHQTGLVAEHPLLVQILADRWRQAVAMGEGTAVL